MDARILAALVSFIVVGGAAVAQPIRAPTGQVQTPNLTVAPASAVDLGTLQQRVQQLEAAHNTTRTELAQTRLELTATRNKLNTATTTLRNYAICERYRLVVQVSPFAGAGTSPPAGCGDALANIQGLANLQ